MQADYHVNLAYEQIRPLVFQLPQEERKILADELLEDEYASTPPRRFTADEPRDEISDAIVEYENKAGCSHDEMLKRYSS